MLEEHLEPVITGIIMVFQQDNTLTHMAKTVKE